MEYEGEGYELEEEESEVLRSECAGGGLRSRPCAVTRQSLLGTLELNCILVISHRRTSSYHLITIIPVLGRV